MSPGQRFKFYTKYLVEITRVFAELKHNESQPESGPVNCHTLHLKCIQFTSVCTDSLFVTMCECVCVCVYGCACVCVCVPVFMGFIRSVFFL